MSETGTDIRELTVEEQFFLDILKDYLHKSETKLPEASLDWKELLDIAWKHEATGILYYQLKRVLDKSGISANQKVKLFKTYANLAMKYDKRVRFLEEIDREFNEKRIPYFIFKGLELAGLYPNPKLRTMGDSDILIHERDENKAHQCILNLGFEPYDIGLGENEWNYRKEDICIELHRKMMDVDATNSRKQMAFFDRRWKYATAEPGSMRHHLDWNYHFIYVLTHLRKHFIISGVGFRQFMDLAIISKECTLDRAWIKKELIALDMWEFAKCCSAFCERWFGIPCLEETAEISDAFYIESTKRIFMGGVFGTEDERNRVNRKIYESGGKAYRLTALQKLKRKLIFAFPPYIAMENRRPYYDFLKGRRYLLPVAWAYRAFRYLTGQVNDPVKDDIGEFTEEHRESRDSILDQWKI